MHPKQLQPTQFFKCIADDTRLRSLLLIQREGELCVCELMEALKESQPKISRHLAQLRQCGLLTDRRQGQWVFYRINTALPEWCQQVLRETGQHNQAFMDSYFKNLTIMSERPQRLACC